MRIEDAFHYQYGLITRAQALAYELSSHQVDYRVKSGRWVVEYPGIYRAREVPPTWESRLLAAVLRSGGVASHRAAAALWGLDVYSKPSTELTVEEGKSVRLGVERIHQSRQWNLRQETTRQRIPCTGIERTILDCAGVVSIDALERMAEAAIRKRYTSWLQLADCLSKHSRRGRNGCLKLRVLLQRRLGNGTVPLSDFSRRVVQLLERAGIPTPVVEYRITDQQGRHILQVDLALSLIHI